MLPPSEDAATTYMPLGDKQFFRNPEDRVRSVETSSGFIMRVLEARRKRLSYTRRTSTYAPRNVECFNLVCRSTLEHVLEECAHHLQRYTDALADQIFVNEFK